MSKRREHPPLSGKQQGIWRSTLAGMEQPVPSFTSFIRKTPPPSGSPSDKPLPPIPTLPEQSTQTIRGSAIPASPVRSASVTSWKAPAAWDEPTTPDQELQPSSAFSPRNYAPLLPDTSPGIFDSDEPAQWPFNVKDTQPRRLDSIHEQTDRVSLSSALELSDSSSSSSSPKPQDEPAFVPSNSNNRKLAVNTTKLYSTSSESSASPTMSSVSPVTPSDGIFRTSNLSTKQKAFASLGIELPGGQRITAENWSKRAREIQLSEGPQTSLSMHGKRLQPVNKVGAKLDSNSSDPDISAKAQHLDAALDYHSVLAGVYHEEHAQDARPSSTKQKTKVPPSSRNAPGKQRSGHRELVPRPLSWKKDSIHASRSSSLSKIDEDVKRIPDSRKRYRKMTNWVPFHQPIHIHKTKGSKEDVAGHKEHFKPPSRKATLEHDPHPKDKHENSHISHVKDFVTHLKKGEGPTNQSTIRSVTCSPSQPDTASTPPPAEQQTRLLRLGGGFAIVRQSPTSTPPSHSSSRLDISPPLPGPASSYGQIPDIEIEPVSRRPSSLYSQQSEPPVAPGISVNKRNLRISPNPSSPQSRSNTSSPPTSPLAHEVSFPRTPPPLSHSPHPPPSRSQRGRSSLDDERTDSGNEDKSHKKLLHIGIMDMARDARHAWKKHNQDAKHEKLKQSIRVLGPTDPGVTAAYVRRQGQADGDENRMPGFLGGGPL